MSKPQPHYFSSPRQENLNPQQLRWNEVRVHDLSLTVATSPGVFARGGLDAGSKLLIETTLAETVLGTEICDLGCGWGPVGCFLARRFPDSRVWMGDINERAVQIAAVNIEHNQLTNARVWCGDGLDAMPDSCFNTILCNPPVRAGNAVIEKLFLDVHRCLKMDGVLRVVLRTAQGAKSWQKKLAAQFGGCETVAIEGGYRILKTV